MKTARKNRNGFSVIELLMAMVILAVLMTAVAVAFDASVINFRTNEGISKTTNAARAALLRMTTELRTSQAVATIGAGGDPDNTQCSFFASDGSSYCYRYNPNDQTLYLDLDLGADSYVLCRHVTAATFNRSTVPSDPTAVRNVRIVMTVTDSNGNNAQTFAAAAVVRRNVN